METNFYTVEQNIHYRVNEQQRLAERIRKVSEAEYKQKTNQQNHQANKQPRKSTLLNLLGL